MNETTPMIEPTKTREQLVDELDRANNRIAFLNEQNAALQELQDTAAEIAVERKLSELAALIGARATLAEVTQWLHFELAENNTTGANNHEQP